MTRVREREIGGVGVGVESEMEMEMEIQMGGSWSGFWPRSARIESTVLPELSSPVILVQQPDRIKQDQDSKD